ncbi:MAG: hypothetical protein HKN17_07020 [Rhodothermales bacterium]|nr:hypothetical protein [Rhodothermales bacterium]
MSRFGLLVAMFTLIAAASQTRSAPAQNLNEVLRGFDGVFTEDERSAVTHAIVTEEGSIFVRRSGGLLYVTVESEPIGVASLCLGGFSEVSVLHASAALGYLRFRSTDDGWTTDDDFVWEMRETSMSTDAIDARAQYFASHGWVATTAMMGDPTATEFLVSEDLVQHDGVRIAAGLMPIERPEVTLALPATASECADDRLVRGPKPDAPIRFDPTAWLHMID